MNTSLVEQFAELKPNEKAQEFYDKVSNIISCALTDIAEELNLNERNVRVFPVGEYTIDTYIDETGELEVVVANSDPQMLIANKTYQKQMQESKTKKERKMLSTKGTTDELINKLFKALLNYFEPETTLILAPEGIKILCKKEYDFNAIVRIGTFDQLDKDVILNFWNIITKQEYTFDVFGYNETLEKKDKKSKGNLKKTIRVLKNLRKTMLINKWITSSQMNRYFVELLAYNVPDQLLKGTNFVEVYTKAMLYLSNCDLQSYVDMQDNLLIRNRLANTDYHKIKRFLALANQILDD